MNEQVLVFVLLGAVFALALALTGRNNVPVASVNWDGAAATTPVATARKSLRYGALGLVLAGALALTFVGGSVASRTIASVNWNQVDWTGSVNWNQVDWTGSVNWSKHLTNQVDWTGSVNWNQVDWTGSVNWNQVDWLGSVNWSKHSNQVDWLGSVNWTQVDWLGSVNWTQVDWLG